MKRVKKEDWQTGKDATGVPRDSEAKLIEGVAMTCDNPDMGIHWYTAQICTEVKQEQKKTKDWKNKQTTDNSKRVLQEPNPFRPPEPN